MQRGRLGLAAVVLATAIFAMFPAAADEGNICTPSLLNPSQSVAGHGFIYCGQHWASFPRTYSVSGVNVAAAQAAAETWNDAWRVVIGNRNAPDILSYSVSSSNQITFANLGANGPVATANITPATTNPITDVDIVLNSDLTWTATPIPPAQGELTGVLGTVVCKALPSQVCGTMYDQQNAITHEFGHFLGLGDLGNPACFPGDLLAPADVDQTMYACIAPGETMKRTLSWGDILGLRQVRVAMGL